MTTPAQPPTPPQLGKPWPRHYKERITITIDPGLLLELDTRGGERSTVLSRDLTRCYAILKDARARLREQFNQDEISLLLDAFNGYVFSAHARHIGELCPRVQDACFIDKLDVKWQVDGPQLLGKLQDLDVQSVLALVDAIERFWVAMGHGDQVDQARALD